MRVAFLNPGSSSDAFFGKMDAFMRIASRQLGIELEVAEGHRQRSRLIEQAEALLTRVPRPDYLILVNENDLAVDLLPRAVAAGIKVFLINEGLMAHDLERLGKPREKLREWLGELLPDDRQAGFVLAKRLIESAAHANLRARDGSIQVVGVAGDYTTSSVLRVGGLSQVVKQDESVVLNAVRLANWDQANARSITASLLEMFPETTVVWAASDLMAAGAIEAIEAAGSAPGREVLVGGIDWAPVAYERVKEGGLNASAGGHFMDGAWALVMLYDHYHGRDFVQTRAKSGFVLLTAENLEKYAIFFDERRWKAANFPKLSKVMNPAVETYNFVPEAVFESLEPGEVISGDQSA